MFDSVNKASFSDITLGDGSMTAIATQVVAFVRASGQELQAQFTESERSVGVLAYIQLDLFLKVGIRHLVIKNQFELTHFWYLLDQHEEAEESPGNFAGRGVDRMNFKGNAGNSFGQNSNHDQNLGHPKHFNPDSTPEWTGCQDSRDQPYQK